MGSVMFYPYTKFSKAYTKLEKIIPSIKMKQKDNDINWKVELILSRLQIIISNYFCISLGSGSTYEFGFNKNISYNNIYFTLSVSWNSPQWLTGNEISGKVNLIE